MAYSDIYIYIYIYSEIEMLSFWWNFHHCLHWKLSEWQLLVQPMMKISSKWWHLCFSAIIIRQGRLEILVRTKLDIIHCISKIFLSWFLDGSFMRSWPLLQCHENCTGGPCKGVKCDLHANPACSPHMGTYVASMETLSQSPCQMWDANTNIRAVVAKDC